MNYRKSITGLVVIDPYNDFISEGGKVWGRIRAVAEANDCVPHMLQVLSAAREAKLRVFYAMHHRYRPGDYHYCVTNILTLRCSPLLGRASKGGEDVWPSFEARAKTRGHLRMRCE